MARHLHVTVLSLMVLLLPLVPADAQQQQREDIVKQRLMADMRELKNQLSQLNKAVNRLEETVSKLRRQNQRNRSRIKKLKQRMNNQGTETDNKSRSSRSARSDRTSLRDTRRESRSRPARSSKESNGDWIDTSAQPYQIRKEPLDHRVIYVTTDDTTLTKLAHQYYRNASFWKTIYEINRDKLPSPDVIPPGINLVLPPVKNLK